MRFGGTSAGWPDELGEEVGEESAGKVNGILVAHAARLRVPKKVRSWGGLIVQGLGKIGIS